MNRHVQQVTDTIVQKVHDMTRKVSDTLVLACPVFVPICLFSVFRFLEKATTWPQKSPTRFVLACPRFPPTCVFLWFWGALEKSHDMAPKVSDTVLRHSGIARPFFGTATSLWGASQPDSQPNKQPASQSQPANQRASQQTLLGQPTSQPNKQPANQPASQTNSQPTSQGRSP